MPKSTNSQKTASKIASPETKPETYSKSSTQAKAPITSLRYDGPLGLFILKILAIVVATLGIYAVDFHGGWLMDDNAYVTQNVGLRDPAGLFNIWLMPGSFVEYYPIEESLLWFLWQYCHNDSFGYHITTTLLHIVGSLMVWGFFTKFNLRFAWLAGFIFAVHPVQVESVAWVAELKNTLSLPPFLIAMGFWVNFENKTRDRDQDYMLALLFFFISMLCKITMAPFPIVMLLYAWWKRGKINLNDVLHTIPFFIISLLLGFASIYVGGYYAPGHVLNIVIPIGDFWSRLACGGLSIAFYFFQVFLPIEMLPAYPQWKIDPPTLQQFLPWPILLALFCWAWARRKTWGKHVILGFGFFLLTIAPFLGFHGISYMRFTWVMDHFLYIPMIGLLGMALAGLEAVYNRLTRETRPVLYGVLTVIALTLTIESAIYASKFQSLETVWSYEIKYNPSAWLAHNNLGYIYVEQNRLNEARDQFIEALRIKPDYSEAHNNLGVVYSRTGQMDKAIEQYEAALKINPDYGDSANNLAKIRQAQEIQRTQGKKVKVTTAPE